MGSCEERSATALDRLSTKAIELNRCTVDDDCMIADLTSQCFSACGMPIGRRGLKEFSQEKESINSSVCDNFTTSPSDKSAACQPTTEICEENIGTRCIENRCVAFILDCEGVPGGSAFENECGICVGGTQHPEIDHGLICDKCVEGPNAEAYPDKDGDNIPDCEDPCPENSDTSCKIDCAGDPGGTAYINECGICVGGSTELPEDEGMDCTGVCGGEYTLDCNNTCGGTATFDLLGICVGGSTGLLGQYVPQACENGEITSCCGNGTIEGSERCDDGNDDDTDACKSNCTWNTCGDGIQLMTPYSFNGQDIFEHCDDGNLLEDDGCPSSCHYEN